MLSVLRAACGYILLLIDVLVLILSCLHHCVTVRPDSCLASSASDQFCSCISFLTIATLSMQLPPINSNWSSLEFIGVRFTSLEYFYSEYILTWFLQFGMMRDYLTLTKKQEICRNLIVLIFSCFYLSAGREVQRGTLWHTYLWSLRNKYSVLYFTAWNLPIPMLQWR